MVQLKLGRLRNKKLAQRGGGCPWSIVACSQTADRLTAPLSGMPMACRRRRGPATNTPSKTRIENKAKVKGFISQKQRSAANRAEATALPLSCARCARPSRCMRKRTRGSWESAAVASSTSACGPGR